MLDAFLRTFYCFRTVSTVLSEVDGQPYFLVVKYAFGRRHIRNMVFKELPYLLLLPSFKKSTAETVW